MHYDIYFGLFMILGKKSPKMTDKFSFDLHKANEKKKFSLESLRIPDRQVGDENFYELRAMLADRI